MSLAVWMKERCVRHTRMTGGVKVMLKHYNRWRSDHRQERCDLETFRALLEAEGLKVVEVWGTLLVLGCGPKSDWDGYRRKLQ
jgi:hypothetical protein